MPPRANLKTFQLEQLHGPLAIVASTLKAISDSFHAPFLTVIAVTAQALAASQIPRQNKAECTELLEKVLQILNAIVVLCVQSPGDPAELPLPILHALGRFTETLHKIHNYLELQQSDGSIIRRLLRAGETAALLAACKKRLRDAVEAFKAPSAQIGGVDLGVGPELMAQAAETRHKELALIADLDLDLGDSSSDASSDFFFDR
ncbi:hypothetical protein C8F01DRAFT_1249302 [Mycena amicta]|nr:hypothetical protein C8F01DRAFT_1249302 [Mycena amicta]